MTAAESLQVLGWSAERNKGRASHSLDATGQHLTVVVAVVGSCQKLHLCPKPEFAVPLCLSESRRTTTGADQSALHARSVCSSREVQMPDVYSCNSSVSSAALDC